MGEHSAPRRAYDAVFMAVYDGIMWVAEHRRKLYAGALVALPLAARYIPGFPADALLDVCKAFLGS